MGGCSGWSGRPLRITEDATLASAPALGERLGTVPGADEVPCKALQLVSDKAVACMTGVLNDSSRDISASSLSKSSLVERSSRERRSVASWGRLAPLELSRCVPKVGGERVLGRGELVPL